MKPSTSRLTDIAIRNLKAKADRYEVSDPGARGLYVCVFPSGKKSYVVRYRHAGLHRKLTLQAGVSLASARKLAADAMHEVAQGRDPIDAKKEAKSKAETAKKNTLANVCAEYIELEHGKLRSAKQRERWMNRLILPEFGSRQIASIKRSEIIRLLDKIEKNSGQRSADTVLSILRSIFAWHALRDDYFRSPIVKGMARYNIKDNKRTRKLDDVELRKVWQAADGNGGYGAFIKFLLLTSARRNEACGLKFSEIKNGVWTLPASRSKTKVEIVRPLSKAAMQIIKAQPRLSDHVFGVDGRPLTAFSRYKKAFDKRCGVRNWVLHDLRRTSRTLLSGAGVNVDIAERCLGHSLDPIRGTYDQHDYEKEMRIAFEKLSALISNIINPDDRVVPMVRR